MKYEKREVNRLSSYKSPEQDTAFLTKWNNSIQSLNGVCYQRLDIPTSLGNTVIWGYNTDKQDAETLVYFPGARTSALFLDLDNVLEALRQQVRLFLVEVNGQPTLSDGNSPSIQGPGYGTWVNDILSFLHIGKAYLAGASLGGLICLKACLAVPEKITAVILLNPAGIQDFSLSFKNLYYNLLPIIFPSKKTITRFLDMAVFCKPHHTVSPAYFEAMIDYQLHTLTRFRYKADKPAKAIPSSQLKNISTEVHLIMGDKDILFPCKRGVELAKDKLHNLKSVHVLSNTGHGIETSREAAAILSSIMLQGRAARGVL